MKQIKIPDSQWSELSGTRPPITLREFKGVNKLDAHSIPDGYATDTSNLTSASYPAMTVRPGNTLLGTSFGTRINGLGVWKDSQLHAVTNGSWYKWSGSTWGTALTSGLNTTANWSFCNFKGNFADINLIGANGIDPIRTYNATSVANLSGAPAGGNYIDQHDNRLYCAVENSVKFSALRKGTDWTTVDDAGEIVFETNNGEIINGLKAGAGHMIVFKPSSVHELYGTNPSNYKKIDVADDIGLISNNCVVSLNGLLYWMDGHGAYTYSGGARPDNRFSIPVQDYISRMNQANKTKSCAGTDGRRLYMSFPMDAATEPDTTLEYDPQFDIWYVWRDINPLYYAQLADKWYIGDTTGKVLQVGGTTNNGSTIQWKWVSRPFDSGSLAQKLRWYKMWIIVDLPPGSTMNIYLSKLDAGDTDWVLAKALTGANGIQSARAIIPVTTVADANYIRVKFEGTGQATIREFDRQQRELPIL